MQDQYTILGTTAAAMGLKSSTLEMDRERISWSLWMAGIDAMTGIVAW